MRRWVTFRRWNGAISPSSVGDSKPYRVILRDGSSPRGLYKDDITAVVDATVGTGRLQTVFVPHTERRAFQGSTRW